MSCLERRYCFSPSRHAQKGWWMRPLDVIICHQCAYEAQLKTALIWNMEGMGPSCLSVWKNLAPVRNLSGLCPMWSKPMPCSLAEEDAWGGSQKIRRVYHLVWFMFPYAWHIRQLGLAFLWDENLDPSDSGVLSPHHWVTGHIYSFRWIKRLYILFLIGEALSQMLYK